MVSRTDSRVYLSIFTSDFQIYLASFNDASLYPSFDLFVVHIKSLLVSLHSAKS
jgi:hypothetical protein